MSRYLPPHQRGGILASPPTPSAVQGGGRGGGMGRGMGMGRAPPVRDEFPSLSSSSTASSSSSSSSGKRFADLAQSWGVKQREEEEEKKRLAKQRMTEEAMKLEKERKERAFYRVGLARASQLIYQKSSGEDATGGYDLGGAKPVDLEEMDADMDQYLPEEEEEKGVNVLDGSFRKSRYDMY